MKLALQLVLALWAWSGARAQEAVPRERLVPIAADVDVVVAGGSCGAVAAACAAADAGARVMLVASRPYLGDDLCGSQSLWRSPSSMAPRMRWVA